MTEKRSKSSQGRSDLGGITLNEVSQTEKDKKRVILLICEIYKTKQMNRRNKTETDSLIQKRIWWSPEGIGVVR